MKKLYAGFILLTLIFSIGCDSIVEPVTQIPDVESTQVSEDAPTVTPAKDILVKSDLARETDPQIPLENLQTLAKNNTEFSSAFYQQIRSKDGNIIFSPFSISLALSMALAGAENATEKTMLDALQITLPEDQVYPSYNALLLEIEASQNKNLEEVEGSEFQLNIANSIWGQSDYNFKREFLDKLARNYGAGLYHVDFIGNPEAAREAINQWIEDETEDKIQDLIPPGAINELTRLVLANAIYFNGSWRYSFEEEATSPTAFNLLDGSQITVDMMKLFDERLAYYKGDTFQAVQLPYLSPDFGMTIILPNEGAFDEFESKLDAETIETITDALAHQIVNLQLPKFDYETSTNAKDPLKALNMMEAFQSGVADFSGISDVEKLFISDVLHKATITVDEKGTEAAAATAVIIRAESAPVQEDPISLIIDRPFLYLIQHNPTGTILFMGRVIQP
jgi:serpin B